MSYFNIIKLDATPSSNDWLKAQMMKGSCADRDLVWVKNQTHGRGQMNKKWESEEGKSLTFSLFKVFPDLTAQNFFLINCAVSLAIVSAVNELTQLNLKVKWPNDILSGRKKIAGILIENMLKGSRIKGSVIGVGINVNQNSFHGLPFASSLSLVLDKDMDMTKLLKVILKHLQTGLDRLSDDDAFDLIRKYEDLLFRKDVLSTFKDNTGQFSGIIQGVTAGGLLKVARPSGKLTHYSRGNLEFIL